MVPRTINFTSGAPMDRETELAIVRQAYAKQILTEVCIRGPRIGAAFAHVMRAEHALAAESSASAPAAF